MISGSSSSKRENLVVGQNQTKKKNIILLKVEQRKLKSWSFHKHYMEELKLDLPEPCIRAGWVAKLLANS